MFRTRKQLFLAYSTDLPCRVGHVLDILNTTLFVLSLLLRLYYFRGGNLGVVSESASLSIFVLRRLFSNVYNWFWYMSNVIFGYVFTNRKPNKCAYSSAYVCSVSTYLLPCMDIWKRLYVHLFPGLFDWYVMIICFVFFLSLPDPCEPFPDMSCVGGLEQVNFCREKWIIA